MFTRPVSTDFSFLIQTRNNPEELKMSIKSIRDEAPAGSEIVVVDGSDSPLGEAYVRSLINDNSILLTYALDEKRGVYNAINVSIRFSAGHWLIVITAGDGLEKGARAILEGIRGSSGDIIVFGQTVIDQEGSPSYRFLPTMNSVWPHQSAVISRETYQRFGLYRTDFRYAACQFLFAIMRKNARVDIKPEVLSFFRLGGLTSGASLKRSQEIFAVQRMLGKGFFTSTGHAYLYPYIRFFLERSPRMRGIVKRLRLMAYPQYKKL